MCKFTFLRILLKDTKLKNKLQANTKFIIARGISRLSQFKTIGSKPNPKLLERFHTWIDQLNVHDESVISTEAPSLIKHSTMITSA